MHACYGHRLENRRAKSRRIVKEDISPAIFHSFIISTKSEPVEKRIGRLFNDNIKVGKLTYLDSLNRYIVLWSKL